MLRISVVRRLFVILLLIVFVTTTVSSGFAQTISVRNEMAIGTSPVFHPPVLKAVKVYADQPFQLEFMLDKGDSLDSLKSLEEESSRLIASFLVALTVPEKDLWVNLSPYEKNRIITPELGMTVMGRKLLEQDYILKQIMSGLMHPEGAEGKNFWGRLYKEFFEKYGTSDIPVETFNKVWIVPEKAVVYEQAGGDKHATACITDARLKVMLESDYLSAEKMSALSAVDGTAETARKVMNETIIPILEDEVNYRQNFAPLRQVYHSIILAAWYKRKIKESLLGSVYVDQKKVEGVNTSDPQEPRRIWNRYVKLFQSGAYNYIRQERDSFTNDVTERKYFSGGLTFLIDKVLETTSQIADSAMSRADLLKIQARIDVGSVRPPADRAGNVQNPFWWYDVLKERPAGSSKYGPMLQMILQQIQTDSRVFSHVNLDSQEEAGKIVTIVEMLLEGGMVSYTQIPMMINTADEWYLRILLDLSDSLKNFKTVVVSLISFHLASQQDMRSLASYMDQLAESFGENLIKISNMYHDRPLAFWQKMTAAPYASMISGSVLPEDSYDAVVYMGRLEEQLGKDLARIVFVYLDQPLSFWREVSSFTHLKSVFDPSLGHLLGVFAQGDDKVSFLRALDRLAERLGSDFIGTIRDNYSKMPKWFWKVAASLPVSEKNFKSVLEFLFSMKRTQMTPEKIITIAPYLDQFAGQLGDDALDISRHYAEQEISWWQMMLQLLLSADIADEFLQTVDDTIIARVKTWKREQPLHTVNRENIKSFIKIVNEADKYRIRFNGIPKDQWPQVRLLFSNGFLSAQPVMLRQLKASANPERLIKAWKGYNPLLYHDFDPENPLKVELEYNRFLRVVRHNLKENNDESIYTFSVFKKMMDGFGASHDYEVTEDERRQLSYTAYEVKKFFDFVVQLKIKADQAHREVMVIPNFTYGWFLSIPIRKQLKRMGIYVADVRVGSTEAHYNDYILAATNKSALFDQETIKFILKEKPVLVFLDGSNSFIRFERQGRYPDAYKAFVNNVMLINYVLAGNRVMVDSFSADRQGVHTNSAHFDSLLQLFDTAPILGGYRTVFKLLGLSPVERNEYQIEYYNPMNERINVTSGGTRGNSLRRIAYMPKPLTLQDLPALNLDEHSVAVMASVNITDDKMPSYMKDLNHGAMHKTAGLDDNIDFIWKVGDTGVGLSPKMSHLFKKAYPEVAALVDEKEGYSHFTHNVPVAELNNLSSLPFDMRTARFGAVMLDVDGAIESSDKNLRESFAVKIAGLLGQGYYVGIASAQEGNFVSGFIDSVIDHMTDLSRLENLYVFEQNGAFGYQASSGKAVLMQSAIRALDQKKMSDAIKNMRFRDKYNMSIHHRSGGLVLEGVEKARRMELVRNLRVEMAGWDLKDHYSIFETGENISIMRENIDKGRAARVLKDVTGLLQKEILKLGDKHSPGENNYPMLALPGGVGVNTQQAAIWILDLLSKSGPLPRAIRKEHEYTTSLEEQALYIRSKYSGAKVTVIGAATPGAGYIPQFSKELGRELFTAAKASSVHVFTGGVGGVGVDVYQGMAEAASVEQGANIDALFSVVLPNHSTPHPGYDQASPGNHVSLFSIGDNMLQRRMALAMISDVLIVINGSSGTLHEALLGLTHGKTVITFGGGGVGDLLLRATQKDSNSIAQILKAAREFHLSGINEEVLNKIRVGRINTIIDEINAVSSSTPDAAQAPGGIDLNPTDRSLDVRKDSGLLQGIKFNVTPDMIRRYAEATGFRPVIVAVTSGITFQAFMGSKF